MKRLAGVLSVCVGVFGCGIPSFYGGPPGGTTGGTASFTISGASGANNVETSPIFSSVSGSYNAANSKTTLVAINSTGNCPQVQIYMNGKADNGKVYSLSSAAIIGTDPGTATLNYAEGCAIGGIQKIWVPSSGNLTVDSAADSNFTVSFSDVPMAPNGSGTSSGTNGTTGTFNVTGSVKIDKLSSL